MPMQNSTIPYHVLKLTPRRFLNLVSKNKIKLIEPDDRIVRRTITKLVVLSTKAQKASLQFELSKN
jgi:hypothetical protein